MCDSCAQTALPCPATCRYESLPIGAELAQAGMVSQHVTRPQIQEDRDLASISACIVPDEMRSRSGTSHNGYVDKTFLLPVGSIRRRNL